MRDRHSSDDAHDDHASCNDSARPDESLLMAYCVLSLPSTLQLLNAFVFASPKFLSDERCCGSWSTHVKTANDNRRDTSFIQVI
jgi:hypothetical protein